MGGNVGRKLGTVVIVNQRTFAIDHPFGLDHTLMHVALGESAVVYANLVGQLASACMPSSTWSLVWTTP